MVNSHGFKVYMTYLQLHLRKGADMSEIEIALRVFYICLTFGFLTLLTVAVVFWQIFSEKDD